MISDTAVVAFDDDEGLAAKGVGTATITCTYESDTTFATKTFTINVTPKGLTANVSHDPITYGDAAPTTGYSVEFEGLVNNNEIAEDAYTVDTEYTKGCKVDNYKFTCVLDTDKIKNYTIGNVTGELVVKPEVHCRPSVTINNPTDKTYTGSPCVQGVSVKDSEAKLTVDDISVTYENNINVGTATIIYTGKNNYTGEIRKNFKITEASITDDMIANIPSVTYDTKAHTPDVTVTFEGSTLEAGKDYDVAYTNNINAGTATVTVTGKGNFTGTASKTFTINKAGLTLNPCTISELCTETDLKTRTLPSDFFLAGETETGFSLKASPLLRAGDDIFAVAPCGCRRRKQDHLPAEERSRRGDLHGHCHPGLRQLQRRQLCADDLDPRQNRRLRQHLLPGWLRCLHRYWHQVRECDHFRPFRHAALRLHAQRLDRRFA